MPSVPARQAPDHDTAPFASGGATSGSQGRYFVDLFSGCGGLSLGLCSAGWKGLFAVEKDEMAFSTFSANFLSSTSVNKFDWPSWIPRSSHNVVDLLKDHRRSLLSLRGSVELIAGGPPCQGFSFAGRRNRADPRNELFRKYIELVKLLKPKALLFENVPGMSVVHGEPAKKQRKAKGRRPTSHLDKLLQQTKEAGYIVHARTVDPVVFGVPQRRLRLIVIGIEAKLAKKLGLEGEAAYDAVMREAMQQRSRLGLPAVITAKGAISDLETIGTELLPCADPQSPKGFVVPAYKGPRSAYQRMLNDGVPPSLMDSTRLARHSPEIKNRFQRILNECRRGVRMDEESRKRFGLQKHRVYPMDPNLPAPTLTTLPDDVLHYSEPRILSVRETARLQSFPDSFVFCGKYTTGGKKRKKECPRYTQVGNAVPPLLARAIGTGLLKVLQSEHPALGAKASSSIGGST